MHEYIVISYTLTYRTFLRVRKTILLKISFIPQIIKSLHKVKLGVAITSINHIFNHNNIREPEMDS